MRILILSEQWFPDYPGGTARVATATAEAWAELGHEVVAVVPRHANRRSVTDEGGVTVRRVLRRSRLPQTATDVVEVARAIRELDLSSFDVTVTHHALAAVAAMAFQPRPPVVYVFHSSPVREARHRRSLGLGLAQTAFTLGVEPLLDAYERLALPRARAILTLSEFSKELVCRIAPAVARRTLVVGGGVDVDLFAPSRDRPRLRERLGIVEADRLVVTVRRLVPRMGLEVLLRAVAQMRAVDERVRLVIVGDGELRGHLEGLAESLAIADAVDFVGRVSDEEVRDWYAAGDVFALPTVAYEGFGMVTAEALAVGTPVVGTDAGATPEVLTGVTPGLVVPADDSEALAAALAQVLTEADFELRERCRAYALESLAWRKVIREWDAAVRLAVAD